MKTRIRAKSTYKKRKNISKKFKVIIYKLEIVAMRTYSLQHMWYDNGELAEVNIEFNMKKEGYDYFNRRNITYT